MLVRMSEIISVVALIVLLTLAKHVPALAGLPLAQVTGVICFSFAIYLALRLFGLELARIRAKE